MVPKYTLIYHDRSLPVIGEVEVDKTDSDWQEPMSELPDLAENRNSESSNENLFNDKIFVNTDRRHIRIINKCGRTK